MRRRSHSPAPHPYTQYLSAIHSDHGKPSTRPPVPAHVHYTGAVPASTLQHHPAYYFQHSLHPHAVVLVHPVLYPSRVDALQPAAAASFKYPAVIVSPHYHTSTSERDTPQPAAKSRLSTASRVRTQLDGHTSSLSGVNRSALSMTASTTATMGSRREDRGPNFPRSQRPSLASHNSNSVPSTPLQLARQYESRSRSPSPSGGLGSHSPRSVSSEANGPLTTLRASKPVACKYETSAAFGRRRILYDIGTDILEKPKTEPKKALDPDEDEKLSGDMRELYDRLLPSEDDRAKRGKFVKKLERILQTEWPGNEFKVHVFGSSGNMLYTSESDIDICIQTPMKRLEEMHMLAEALDRHGMERVVCIPAAKVRIVKVWDPELQLASDMNVNNTLALENTRMIQTYIQMDDRVRPLAMIIKHWTKRRILNDAGLGGTISSYTWICMILNFLQTRNPPILPSLHKLPYRKLDETGKRSQSEFADDLDKLRGYGKDNKETLGQLLFAFFRSYGYEIDFEKMVVSVREGRLLTREEKIWHLAGLKKEGRDRLCVEEPFNTERNLGNTADDTAWRGIHLEIRRAFDLLADNGQIDKAFEQYEYPPAEEKTTTIFKRPTTTVKPVLQMPNKPGRVVPGLRGGRPGYGHKNTYNSQRRLSSGASFGSNRPPSLPNGTMQDYGVYGRGLNDNLEAQLVNQFLALEMQSNSLQAQFHARQRQALLQAHQVAQSQGTQGQAHGTGRTSSGGSSSQKSPYLGGPTSPQLADMGLQPSYLHHNLLYHYPFDPNQQPGGVSQNVPRTNPSSPAPNSTVLRRSAHRLSNASEAGSRSHSQPARGVEQTNGVPAYSLPTMQYFDPANYPTYPIAHSMSEQQPSVHSETGHVAASTYPGPLMSADRTIPGTYVGFSVENRQDYSVPPIPSFQELAQRRRRVSPEITTPLLNTALRRVSRSPSPLGEKSHSYSSSGTPPAVAESKPKENTEPSRPVEHTGPVIVNGSVPLQAREGRSQSEVMEAFPSLDLSHQPNFGAYYTHAHGDHFRAYPDQYQHFYHEDYLNHGQVEGTATSEFGNGYRPETTAPEMNGLARVSTTASEPFSHTLESWRHPNQTSNQYANQPVDASPKRTHASPRQPNAYANPLKPLEIKNAPRPPPQEIKSATLQPLLSPVLETRTPSPTANRQPPQEIQKAANGTATQPKENQHNHHRRGSHTPKQSNSHKEQSKEGSRNHQKGNGSSSETSSRPKQLSTNNAGTWQPSSNKKSKRKGKGNRGTEQKTSGEPLPANASERKGG